MLGLVVLALLLRLGPATAGPYSGSPDADEALGGASAQGYTYDVRTRGDVKGSIGVVKQVATEALTDIRGWSLHFNLDFTRVGSGGDFHVILASPEQVDAASPVCTAQWSCRVGDDVLVNDDRWRKGAAAWTKSLREYRRYVINHEVGHWLGLGHSRCPGQGKAAPVMMQQSKGLNGCTAQVWPKFGERNRVANAHNVKGWPTPPPDAPCTISGTAGDDVLEGTNHADVICGRGGNDELSGRGGYDLLRGAWGDDDLRGGAKDDVLDGGPGGDLLLGGGGGDQLRGGGGPDTLLGGAGSDLLVGGPGPDTVHGMRGHDVLKGWGGDDLLVGWGGNDELSGMGGDDELRGGSGADLLDGGSGIDACDPGPGSDEVTNCEG